MPLRFENARPWTTTEEADVSCFFSGKVGFHVEEDHVAYSGEGRLYPAGDNLYVVEVPGYCGPDDTVYSFCTFDTLRCAMLFFWAVGQDDFGNV